MRSTKDHNLQDYEKFQFVLDKILYTAIQRSSTQGSTTQHAQYSTVRYNTKPSRTGQRRPFIKHFASQALTHSPPSLPLSLPPSLTD